MREPNVDELMEGVPQDVARENARRKATAVAEDADDAAILGVDTVVCLGNTMYGKPRDEGDARATLTALAGRRHDVISGLCVLAGGSTQTATATTAVSFRQLDEQLIAWYLASGEWRGRAGGYAIQGRGAALVQTIDGDYLNVVGLPLACLLNLVPGLLAGRL